ncbi:MAG: pseudouridine-5'-phosphate glycosidase [Pseudomonadota bacterium]
MNQHVRIQPEVADAVRAGGPVVALESTIISHGMPWPENLTTATAVEQAVRDEGAVPATIALVDGHIAVGLSPDELERFAQSDKVEKVSRRDVARVLVAGLDGATTVATTMWCAHLAGIRVFATGGLGGVHRDVAETGDISADLEELARTPVAVVCAGAKSILDIGRTLQYLETKGVPVYGYRCGEFPAFYSSRSGHRVDQRFDSAEALARALAVQWSLGLDSGVVIGNPIPKALSLPSETVELAVQAALTALREERVSGPEVTPFLLKHVAESTGGDSLASNIALIKHNAATAAQLAVALAGQQQASVD